MAAKITLHVEPWQDLAYINGTAIPDSEKDIGPLVEIDHDSKSTLLTFLQGDPPKAPTAVALEQGGKPVIPAGASLIDEGVIFVGGALVLCAATR